MNQRVARSVSVLRYVNALCWVFALFGLACTSYAQLRPATNSSQTRAVVVGVAEYQDKRIPSLQYSHRDAELFADWLRSPAGGNVAEENIRVLTNGQATNGQIASAFTWLMESSNEGDVAILYFSGHGDTENHTVMNHGFLLAYDAPASNYMAGGFPIFMLQSIIQTISTQKKAQVIMIADACRSGKLAGTEYDGTQATAKVLSDQFANEAKILSCQPNEFSLEGPQWGGGHGVFTYYLVDGLMGMADRNEDLQVNLLELERYLQDHVTAASAPKSQIPTVVGNKGMIISNVDEEALAALKQRRADPANNPEGTIQEKGIRRGSDDSDSLVMIMYQQFRDALTQKQLLRPAGSSAYDLYKRIHEHKAIAPYRLNMRLDLAAALQDEAQQALNDYLAANPAELQRRWNYDTRYEEFPKLLQKAAEVLGKDHFMYRDLQIREAYFHGLQLRLDGEKTRDTSLYRQAKEWQQQVIQLDTSATFAYNELGLLSRRARNYEESIGYFQRALAFAPTWVLARTNLCGSLLDLEQPLQAKEQCLKALHIDSTFALAHYNLGRVYFSLYEREEAVKYYKSALKLDPDYLNGYLGLGDAYHFLGNLTAALATYESLLQRDSTNSESLFKSGKLHIEMANYEAALKNFETVIRLNPDYPDVYIKLGVAYYKLGNLSAALATFESLLQKDSTNIEGLFHAGVLHTEMGNYDAALKVFKRLVEIHATDGNIWFGICLNEAHLGRPEQALKGLEQALLHGFREKDTIEQEPALAAMRTLSGYSALMEQYFGG